MPREPIKQEIESEEKYLLEVNCKLFKSMYHKFNLIQTSKDKDGKCYGQVKGCFTILGPKTLEKDEDLMSLYFVKISKPAGSKSPARARL